GEGDEHNSLAGRRIDAQELVDAHLEPRLLLHLASRGVFDYLSGVNESRGEGPATHLGVVVALAEDDTAIHFHPDADCDLGVFEVDVAAPGADAARLAERLTLLQLCATLTTEGSHRI